MLYIVSATNATTSTSMFVPPWTRRSRMPLAGAPGRHVTRRPHLLARKTPTQGHVTKLIPTCWLSNMLMCWKASYCTALCATCSCHKDSRLLFHKPRLLLVAHDVGNILMNLYANQTVFYLKRLLYFLSCILDQLHIRASRDNCIYALHVTTALAHLGR